jgi:Protein of unknown function (DUF4089)
MKDSFDPVAFLDAAAPLIGVKLTLESRAPIVVHLKIAAELAAKLEEVELGDEAEPAPVFTP